MSYPDLAAPIRTALIGASAVTTNLTAYASSWPVFTRRPVPEGAPWPMIIVSPDVAVDDQDGINDQRPIITRDVTVFGQNDTATHYRAVETLAREVRDLFHRQRDVITVSGWSVINIITRGPIPAPVDDDQTVARLVTLRVELAKQN